MKYKLKKDLPFAKAGADIRWNNDLDCYEVMDCSGFNWRFIGIGFSEVWMKEVAPREFFIIQNASGDLGAVRYELDAYKISGEIIKVREVL